MTSVTPIWKETFSDLILAPNVSQLQLVFTSTTVS